MKKVLKQVLAVDVAQSELVVCLGKLAEDLTIEKCGGKVFVNSKKGFDLLLQWVGSRCGKDLPVRFVMEATGVYHESFAYYLHDLGHDVSIVTPSKISNYMRTLEMKTITDKTASEAILRFALERKLDLWAPPKGIYKKLQQLTRERGQLIDERTVIKNQLHAEKAEGSPHKKSIARGEKRIKLLITQEREIMQELNDLIKSDEDVRKAIMLICTIPGIGLLTAAVILGETTGFDLIRNKKQLTSYAGLDPKEKQSGTSVHIKAKISKRGNKHLRKAMHMPALCAIRTNERYKSIFARLVSQHGIKMKAAVAVQRKLLELSYVVYKTQQPFDKEYLKTSQPEISMAV